MGNGFPANLIREHYILMVISNDKVIKNASWIIACKIVQSIIAFIINTISARYLGPSDYGLINYAISVVAFAVPVAQLGLRNVLVEEIVSHPEREGKALGTTIGLSIVSGLFCLAGCLTFVLLTDSNEQDTITVCSLYGISLIFQMTEMIQYWYQAKLLSKYTSVASLLAYTVVAGYKVFLLVTQKSVYWFAVSYAFDYALISIILFILYKKLGTQKLSFSFELGKQLFARSRYYIVSNMMITIFSQTDRVMIKMMLGNAETGFYSTACTCAGLSAFIFVAVIDSMRPMIFESKKISQAKFERSVSVLYSIVIYMALCQSVILTVFAKPIISLLYGSAYSAAIPLLQIVTWYSAFSYMGSVRNIWMLAEEKQKCLWIVNLSGAVLNVVGNALLIPTCGAAGAAIASVITQFFTNFVLCLLMKQIKPTAKLIFTALNPWIIKEMLPHRGLKK